MTTVQVRAITPHFGAEIIGLDPRAVDGDTAGVQIEGPTRTLRKAIAPVETAPGQGPEMPTFDRAC